VTSCPCPPVSSPKAPGRWSPASGVEKTDLEQQIAHTDAEIDALVYDLYGLTEEEIAIVEGR
jgi:hypothetical protein